MPGKTFFTSLICMALFISVSAQKAYWAPPDDSIARKLIAMEKMWLESDCSPQPALKGVFADEFQGTWIDGTRYGKDQALSPAENPHRQCQLGDVRIQFFGESVAVAYGSESAIRIGADKLFNGLLAGGQIEMPFEESPRRSYFGIFRDRYGIEWMVDFDSEIKGQTPLIMAEEKGSKETIDILTKKEGK